jgi:hypothetical protein
MAGSSNIAKARNSSGQAPKPAWRVPTPDCSSDEEKSTPAKAKPWLAEHLVTSVTENVESLGLGSKDSLSPRSKAFWIPTDRTVSVTTHSDEKGRAVFEQSFKRRMPMHIHREGAQVGSDVKRVLFKLKLNTELTITMPFVPHYHPHHLRRRLFCLRLCELRLLRPYLPIRISEPLSQDYSNKNKGVACGSRC